MLCILQIHNLIYPTTGHVISHIKYTIQSIVCILLKKA